MMNINTTYLPRHRNVVVLALVVLLAVAPDNTNAGVGYFGGMYVIVDVNGGGNGFYQVVSPDSVSGNQEFNSGQGQDLNWDLVNPIFDDLGSFDPSAGDSLVLNGFEMKTFNDNGDSVDDVTFSYRLTRAGDAPGAFTAVFTNTPVDVTGNDKTWQVTNAGHDLLTGLSPGNYTLEFFHRSTASFPGGTFEMGNWNNPDILPAATFAVLPEPASSAMMMLGFVGILAWVRRRFDRQAGHA